MEDIITIPSDVLGELNECLRVIHEGEQTFVQVGMALHRVMDRQLFRYTHADFKAWCKDHLPWSYRHAQRLMDGATTVKVLENECAPKMTNWSPPPESIVRELQSLPVDRRAAAYEAVVASGEKVTAKTVQAAVVEFKRRTTPPPLPAPPPAGTLRPEVALAIEEGGGRFGMLAARVVELTGDFRKLFAEPAGTFLNPQEVEALLDGLKRIVRFSTPWSDCVHCSQVGCSECRGTGWLCRDRFESAPAELRERSLVKCK